MHSQRDIPLPSKLAGPLQPKKAWTRRDIRRAMTLIGGLDEKMAQEILDQEGL